MRLYLPKQQFENVVKIDLINIGFYKMSFSPSDIEGPSIIVAIGDQGAGKSTLATDLLLKLNESIFLDMACAVTTSDDPTYLSNILDNDLVLRDRNPVDVANAILKSQKSAQSVSRDSVPRLAILFDDVFTSPSEFKSMTTFLNKSRDANIVSIFTSADTSIFPTFMMKKINYTFLSRSIHVKTRKDMWSKFGGIYESFDAFDEALTDLSAHDFLTINNNSRSKALADIVSIYKADIFASNPITAGVANAHGKWHLLDEGVNDKDTIVSQIHEDVDEEGNRIETEINEHRVFNIGSVSAKTAIITALDMAGLTDRK